MRPALSVVLPTDSYETIQPVVEALRRQTVRDRIELVIVAPPAAPMPDDAEWDGLAGMRVVRVADVDTFGLGRAAGVREATAPIVVIGETHTYPHAGWAEALLEAHTKPWPIVVPGFGNANPTGALSWAIFLMDYGRWLADLPAGETDLAPTHNSSYKREALLELGPALDRALAHGDDLALHCSTTGQRAYFAPAARIDHLNISQPGPWLEERFLGGLLIGGHRAERWPAWRRVLYFGGSVLVAPVLLYRLRHAVRAALREHRLPIGTLPALVAGTVVWAAGEALGYARGARRSESVQMTEYELHKVRYAV